ncbi:hypothetical protein ACFSUS_02995 [Spirosoma soli]|uniref:Uncharacterized protein n=1 Tax=Spirosoma soli TaxID=1770529 RepID=A0ABW5LZ75_9BACT
MNEALKLVLALAGLLIASGLLTYFTKPAEYLPATTARKKKRHKKTQLRDAQPYLTDDGFVALDVEGQRYNAKTKRSERVTDQPQETLSADLGQSLTDRNAALHGESSEV